MSTEEINLACIELPCSPPATHSIIVLHGLGADGSDFVPIVPELKLPSTLPVRFIFPHAPMMPVTINNGYEMRAWYDIASPALVREIDQTGIQTSVKLVEKFIENEIQRGIAPENIILAGFSQGAVMALAVGLTYFQSLGGIIALSGYLPFDPTELKIISASKQNVPIFLAHGTEDFIVPYALGKAAYAALKEAHLNVEWHSYPIGHSVSAEEIDDISRWLQARWC